MAIGLLGGVFSVLSLVLKRDVLDEVAYSLARFVLTACPCLSHGLTFSLLMNAFACRCASVSFGQTMDGFAPVLAVIQFLNPRVKNGEWHGE
jgi:hypothetical protein